MPTLNPPINLDERVSLYFIAGEGESASDAFHELTALLHEQGIETTTPRRVNPIEPELWTLSVSILGVGRAGLQLLDVLLKVIERFKKARPTRDVTLRKGDLEIVGSADDIKILLPALTECKISIGKAKASKLSRSK